MPGILYRTTDDDKWGDGKGANLTPTEVDLNFWDHEQRLNEVEENPAQPKNIDHITVSGNQMTIVLDDASTFGPFTLPEAVFEFTGNFVAAHVYHTYDFFLAGDGLYMVLRNHTSAGAFNPEDGNIDGDYYQLILPFPNLYDIGFFYPGTPGRGIEDGEALFTFRANRNFYLVEDLPVSTAGVQTAPDGTLVFPVYKNATAIGSITIASGETVGTFTFPADVQFASGDRLRVVRAGTLDVTATDFSINFAARKGLLP